MGLPTLRTHRLPVQRCWRLQRRLATRRTTDGQGRSVAGMVQPIRPHDPRLGQRHMPQPALEKVGDGQSHPLGCGLPSVCLLRAQTIAEGDALAVLGHEARVFDRATPEVASQIRHDACTVAIALHDAHVPFRLPRVTQTVQQVEQLLRPHRLRQG